MITEKDLHEAIAECQGERNPNANTCLKLAAFYTIKDHMFGTDPPLETSYSYSAGDSIIHYDSGTEFSESINGMQTGDLLDIMDELMSTLQIVQPRLYAGVMRKIKSLE